MKPVPANPGSARLDRLDVAPLPERVKAALLDMIVAGSFADGRLPREEVLVHTFAKLNVRSRSELAAETIKRGLG